MNVLKVLRDALYHGVGWEGAAAAVFAPDALVRWCFPFEDQTAEGAVQNVWGSLFAAWPDVERRESICIQGVDDHGLTWVGIAGTYVGTFEKPWLDIPATRRVCHMRFHEFYQIEDGKIAQVQALWDIPEVMMQAGAWPMAPSLGRDWNVPGPATCDGMGPHGDGRPAQDLIVDMLTTMKKHPAEGGPEMMELPKFWHPKMNWYGPAGIGTGRGIDGFRKMHQIPFLNALPDRGTYPDETTYHFMAQGNYVGVTGWPNMMQTVTGGGWMGIAPNGTKVGMRSLDFWRIEDGLIRENWVLVDLLHMYDQIGVDVFARMRELTGPGN